MDDSLHFLGAKCEKYCWAQQINEIILTVYIPPHANRRKQLGVELLGNKNLRVHFDGGILLQGELLHPISSESLTWTFIRGEYIQIYADKLTHDWWNALFEHDAKLDLSQLDTQQSFYTMTSDEQQLVRNLFHQQAYKTASE